LTFYPYSPVKTSVIPETGSLLSESCLRAVSLLVCCCFIAAALLKPAREQQGNSNLAATKPCSGRSRNHQLMDQIPDGLAPIRDSKEIFLTQENPSLKSDWHF
jgi:hypothetical protein